MHISCRTCRYAANLTFAFYTCKKSKHPLRECIDREYYYWENRYKGEYINGDFIEEKEMEL